MKDALGHGSNPRGTHAEGIAKLRKRLSVEGLVSYAGRTAAGQRVTNVGAVWKKIASGKRRAVAERIAQNARVDNPDMRIRIR